MNRYVMAKISLSNIAEELAEKSGITRDSADRFVHAFITTIEKGLQEDNLVKIKGLGTFKLQEMSDRDSVDVNTGERITIKGYRKVTFTPDSAMKELVNRPFAHFEPTELNDGYPEVDDTLTMDNVSEESEDSEIMAEAVVEVSGENVAEEPIAEEITAEDANEEEVAELVEEAIDEVGTQEEDIIEQGSIAPSETPVITTPEVDVHPVAPTTEEASEQEGAPMKYRALRAVLILLLIGAVIGTYHYYFGTSLSEGQFSEEDMEDHNGMVVNPNLEEELGAEWGDEEDNATQMLDKKNAHTEIAKEQTGDTDSSNPADGVSVEVESAPVVVPEAKIAESVNPIAPVKSVELASGSTAEENSCAVVLIESLLAKNLKDITLTDTTDYIPTGTWTTHSLKRGETIIQLAKQYYGDKRLWPYIVKYNKMKDFNNVAIGQKVLIPVLKER